MRLYASSLESVGRLRFGRRLMKALARFERTADLAEPLREAQIALAEAERARAALEEPLDDASDDLRFAELACEAQIRRVFNRCKELDGDRIGPVTKVGFGKGVTAVIAPKGASQAKALAKLHGDYKDANVAELAPHRDAIVQLLDQAKSSFQTALDAYEGAFTARLTAFSLEKLRRAEHRRTVDAIFGGIREAFPGDTALHNAIVPRVDRSESRDDDEPDDDDGDDGADAPATPPEPQPEA